MWKVHKLFGTFTLQVFAVAFAFASFTNAAESSETSVPFKCVVDLKPQNAMIDVGKTTLSGKCERIKPICTRNMVALIEKQIKESAVSLGSTQATSGHVLQTFLRLRLSNCNTDSASNFDAPFNSRLVSLACLPDKRNVCDKVTAKFSFPPKEGSYSCTADLQTISPVKTTLCMRSFTDWSPPTNIALQANTPVSDQSSVIRDASFAGLGIILLTIARWLLAMMQRKTVGSAVELDRVTSFSPQVVRVTARFTDKLKLK
jgi:hypothetical protein